MTGWLETLNSGILHDYNTRITGGFEEPFYRAPAGNRPAEIRFTRDYERSALHELAHWCVAGNARRSQDDYGYWYAPDGRTDAEQQRFFQAEVRPQAIERFFCDALGIDFDVSADNLANPDTQGLDDFRAAVETLYRQFNETGLPGRAAAVYRCLDDWRNRAV